VKKQRRWLIEAIRKRLLPEFGRRGFELVPIAKDRPTDRELIVNFPFGTLRRPVTNGFELVDIQLGAHGDAAFRLLAGFSPQGGMDTFNGHFAAEDVLIGWLDEFFEVYERPRLWAYFPSLAYFSVRRWRSSRITPEDYDHLVDRVAGLIPEIETALKDDTCGPHVRRVRIQHPRPTSQPGGLIRVLLDAGAAFGDRLDAAIDLGDFDEAEVEAVLTRLACDADTDDELLDACGESLADIWCRKGDIPREVVTRLTPTSLRIALATMQARAPDLAAKAEGILKSEGRS
jgi:hypothetical protein